MKFLLSLLFPKNDSYEPIGLSALRVPQEKNIEEDKSTSEETSLSFLRMAKDLY